MAVKGKKVTGVCKLCLEDKELDDSHIVPKFVWKAFKKQNEPITEYSIFNKFTRNLPTGTHEYLLCNECEGVIGRYEDYASEFLSNRVKSADLKSGDRLLLTAKDDVKGKKNKYNYVTLKLFFLSILWRTSVSSLPQYNKCILGEKYEELIRRALLNTGQLRKDDFPITIRCYNVKGDNFDAINLAPQKYRCHSFHKSAYFFIAFGLGVFIGVGDFSEYQGDVLLLKGDAFREDELLIHYISIEDDSKAMETFMHFRDAGNFHEQFS